MIIGDVSELLAVVLGDDELQSVSRGKRVGRRSYSMTLAEGANVKESEGLVTLKKLEARDFTCD